jgi:signal transduction histidine kinase
MMIRVTALTVRTKLVVLSLLILVVVSFGFTVLLLHLSAAWVEEDLRERAIAFAREVAATIGDRREFESAALLRRQIDEIMDVRRSVLQLDVLSFGPGTSTAVVATSHPATRLPFTRREMEQVRKRRVVSRLVAEGEGRYWEIIAPVLLDGEVAGAVAAKFSSDRAEALASRIRSAAVAITSASVIVMALLMSLAVHLVVNRPLMRFMEAMRRVQQGDTTATVDVTSRDELGELAQHFATMLARIRDFNDELQRRVKEATAELEQRYVEVERLHEALFSMQRTLGHAERLALSGRLMAEVAHEVGTPLHSVAGHLELLRQDLPPGVASGDLHHRLDVIDGQLRRVIEIIARLLDLTRRASREATLVDLNGLVRDCVDLVRPGVVSAGIGLTLDADPRLVTLRGHADQLQQVVLNLLTNAIDATAPGGRIRVQTRGDESAVELHVSDTGHGISDADRSRIFEPFFSTKEPGRGTGLGLFVSAQIVREHRGRIEVTSAEGAGSTFRVVLPKAA